MALSQKGSAEAKRCISTRRARAFGSDNVLHIKNNCSKVVGYSWCYPRMTDSSSVHIYKCDIGARYSFSAADSVGAFDENWFLSSNKARVRYGVCMKDVVLDGKTYSHGHAQRTGENQYKCNYSTYGR